MIDPAHLQEPRHRLGYPWSQLQEMFDAQQIARLQLWMDGQTMAFDGEAIVYPHDLQRWLAGGRIVD